MAAFLVMAPSALAATYVVTSSGDPATDPSHCNPSNSPATNTCTLRDAMEASNASTGTDDTITFAAGISPALTAGQIVVSDTVVIDGNNTTAIPGSAGSAQTTISASGGNSGGRAFYFTAGSDNSTLRDVAVKGFAQGLADGGALYSLVPGLTFSDVLFDANSAAWGGAVSNGGGSLTISDSTFNGNTATSGGGGIDIYAATSVVVQRSTFSGNQAGGSGGGILDEAGTLTLTNSTLSGNQAGVSGGGLAVGTGADVLAYLTVTGNSAGGDGEGIYNGTAASDIQLRGSIVAFNDSGAQCAGADATPIASGGHNISSDTTCATGATGDQQSRTPGQVGLGGLSDNGGLTQTHAIGVGSVAYNTGETTCPSPDQRGIFRPQDSVCDVGAYEVLSASGGGGGTTGGGTGGTGTSVPPGTGADLRLDATPPDPGFVGDTLTYEYTVINDGPEQANSVYLIDQLPTQAAVQRSRVRVSKGGVTTRLDQTSCSGTTTLTCPLGDIPARGVVTISVAVKALRAGSLQNIAGVSSFAGNSPTDPNPSNNLVNIVTQVNRVAAAGSPRFLLGISTIQNVLGQGGIVFKARPQTNETITASATTNISTSSRVFRFRSTRRFVRARRSATLKVRVTPALRRNLRAALRRNRRVFATLRVRGRTRSGRTYATSRRIRLVD
jgi:uncharacterized repeat protein (TIGR01451 family)